MSEFASKPKEKQRINCIEVLKERNYNLEGYSQDTYYLLMEADVKNPDECEELFAWLERVYG